MSNAPLYDDDILAWSEEQAAALRRLASRAPRPNDVDFANVIEEIADAGIAELNTERSLLTRCLMHAIKLASAPDARAADHLFDEILVFQRDASRRFVRSMTQRIDLDALWRDAVQDAGSALARHGNVVIAGLPITCPVALSVLVEDDPDPDRLIAAIVAASTGQPPLTPR